MSTRVTYVSFVTLSKRSSAVSIVASSRHIYICYETWISVTHFQTCILLTFTDSRSHHYAGVVGAAAASTGIGSDGGGSSSDIGSGSSAAGGAVNGMGSGGGGSGGGGGRSVRRPGRVGSTTSTPDVFAIA